MLNEFIEKYKQNVHNIVTAYQKNKTDYDRKNSAEPLKLNKFGFLLNPKYENQRSKQHFISLHWQGPYKVFKVLNLTN